MSLQYVGNAAFQQGTLGSSYTAGGTSLVLTGGDGANFPASGDFWVRVQTSVSDASDAEIFKVTARSTDTLTVTGAQDGTSNVNHGAGSIVVWVLSASALTQLKADVTIGAQGLVLLEQHTASSSASLDFTSCISSTYDDYQLELIQLVPASDGVSFGIRVSTDGGSTYVSSADYSSWILRFGSGGSTAGGGTGLTFINMFHGDSMSNNSNWGLSGNIKLFNPLSASSYKLVSGQLVTLNQSGSRACIIANGAYESTTAVNAFQFIMSSGNIASGTIRVYGIVK